MSISPDIVGTAATTVGSFLAVNILGAIAAHYPKHPSGRVGPSGIVPQAAIASLSRITTTIFVPCLTFFSLGSRLSVEALAESWPMFFWAPVNVFISVILGLVTMRLACVPAKFHKEFLIGCGFTNILAVPLIMIEVLCDQEQLAQEEECFERGASFTFVYVFGWSLCFWTIGLVVIRSIEGGEHAGRKINFRDSIRGLVNPPMLGCLIGAFVGLIAPLRRAIFSDGAPLLFISSASNAYGSSVVGMLTLVMAATLGKSLTSLNPRDWCSGTERKASTQSSSSVSKAADSAAGDTASAHGAASQLEESSESLQRIEEAFTSRPSDGAVFVVNEGDGASVHTENTIVDLDEVIAQARSQAQGAFPATPSEGSRRTDTEAIEPPSIGNEGVTLQHSSVTATHSRERWDVRTLLAFVAVSMFVAPAIKFGLVILLGDHIFIGDNASLLQLVLSIQCVTPTANLVVVVSQREGNRAVAERLSRGVVMQYVSAVVTLLVVTTLAVSSFYGGDAGSAGDGDVVQNATSTLAATLASTSTATAGP